MRHRARLDLDDDAIVAALGFSGPGSLCSATMTCRRLRRLADATWPELDKNIDADKLEGGDSPRERVLSSFIIQVEKDRISREVITRIGDMQHITPTELTTRDYLLYLQMTDMFNGHIYYDSFIGSSGALLLNDFVGIWFRSLPLQRELAQNDFDAILSDCCNEDAMINVLQHSRVALFFLENHDHHACC